MATSATIERTRGEAPTGACVCWTSSLTNMTPLHSAALVDEGGEIRSLGFHRDRLQLQRCNQVPGVRCVRPFEGCALMREMREMRVDDVDLASKRREAGAQPRSRFRHKRYIASAPSPARTVPY